MKKLLLSSVTVIALSLPWVSASSSSNIQDKPAVTPASTGGGLFGWLFGSKPPTTPDPNKLDESKNNNDNVQTPLIQREEHLPGDSSSGDSNVSDDVVIVEENEGTSSRRASMDYKVSEDPKNDSTNPTSADPLINIPVVSAGSKPSDTNTGATEDLEETKRVILDETLVTIGSPGQGKQPNSRPSTPSQIQTDTQDAITLVKKKSVENSSPQTLPESQNEQSVAQQQQNDQPQSQESEESRENKSDSKQAPPPPTATPSVINIHEALKLALSRGPEQVLESLTPQQAQKLLRQLEDSLEIDTSSSQGEVYQSFLEGLKDLVLLTPTGQAVFNPLINVPDRIKEFETNEVVKSLRSKSRLVASSSSNADSKTTIKTPSLALNLNNSLIVGCISRDCPLGSRIIGIKLDGTIRSVCLESLKILGKHHDSTLIAGALDVAIDPNPKEWGHKYHVNNKSLPVTVRKTPVSSIKSSDSSSEFHQLSWSTSSRSKHETPVNRSPNKTFIDQINANVLLSSLEPYTPAYSSSCSIYPNDLIQVTYAHSPEPIKGHYYEVKESITGVTLQDLLVSTLRTKHCSDHASVHLTNIIDQNDRELIALRLVQMLDWMHTHAKHIHCNFKPGSVRFDVNTGALKMTNFDRAVPMPLAAMRDTEMSLFEDENGNDSKKMINKPKDEEKQFERLSIKTDRETLSRKHVRPSSTSTQRFSVNSKVLGTQVLLGHQISWGYAAPEQLMLCYQSGNFHHLVNDLARDYNLDETMSDLSFDGAVYADKGDIWALGCMLHQLFTGHQHPFFRSSDKMDRETLASACLEYLQDKRMFLNKSSKLSGAEMTLLKGCLAPKPADRWSIRQVMRSEWMKAKLVSLKDAKLSQKTLGLIAYLNDGNKHLPSSFDMDRKEFGEVLFSFVSTLQNNLNNESTDNDDDDDDDSDSDKTTGQPSSDGSQSSSSSTPGIPTNSRSTNSDSSNSSSSSSTSTTDSSSGISRIFQMFFSSSPSPPTSTSTPNPTPAPTSSTFDTNPNTTGTTGGQTNVNSSGVITTDKDESTESDK